MRSFFAFQVISGREDQFYQLLYSTKTFNHKVFYRYNVEFFYPRRKLAIRNKGKITQVAKAIFPGYLFFSVNKLNQTIINLIRNQPWFIRFLPNNQHLLPLAEKDCRIVNHLLGFGQIIEPSKITFNENQRIKVVSGVLSGFEGAIVKVNRRKKRAKVRLDITNEAFVIDFPFEIIEQSECNS